MLLGNLQFFKMKTNYANFFQVLHPIEAQVPIQHVWSSYMCSTCFLFFSFFVFRKSQIVEPLDR